MSINKPLFDDIYHNCSDIISKSSDNNIQKKRVKLNSAYTKLCVEENPELQEFYSIVHELRLYQYIKDLGIAINAANDEKAGPDFITDLGYIECISATKGLLGTPERQWLDKRLKESMNRYIAALPRLSGAILDKEKKYGVYIKNQKLDPQKPRIIAVSTSIFSNEFRSELCMELIFKILYGIGCSTLAFNLKTNSFVDEDSIDTRSYEDIGVKPPKNIELPLNYFEREEFSEISGVIINNNSIGEELQKNYCCLLLNNLAKVPINRSLLNGIKYFAFIESDDKYKTYRWFNE